MSASGCLLIKSQSEYPINKLTPITSRIAIVLECVGVLHLADLCIGLDNVNVVWLSPHSMTSQIV